MSTGWENHEPSPIEYMHHELLEIFHDSRRRVVGQEVKEISMDGIFFNNIVAEAKRRTYLKYKKLNLDKAILKSEL